MHLHILSVHRVGMPTTAACTVLPQANCTGQRDFNVRIFERMCMNLCLHAHTYIRAHHFHASMHVCTRILAYKDTYIHT